MLTLRTHLAVVTFDPHGPHAYTLEDHPEDRDVTRLMLDYQANHEMVCLYEGEFDLADSILDELLRQIKENNEGTLDLQGGALDLRSTIDAYEDAESEDEADAADTADED